MKFNVAQLESSLLEAYELMLEANFKNSKINIPEMMINMSFYKWVIIEKNGSLNSLSHSSGTKDSVTTSLNILVLSQRHV